MALRLRPIPTSRVTDTVIKRLVIRGRVQGVGYRASFYYAAKNAGVTGWVRNRRDGSVEAMVQGPLSAIDDVIEWARRGPELARVDNLVIEEGSGTFSDFTVGDTL